MFLLRSLLPRSPRRCAFIGVAARLALLTRVIARFMPFSFPFRITTYREQADQALKAGVGWPTGADESDRGQTTAFCTVCSTENFMCIYESGKRVRQSWNVNEWTCGFPAPSSPEGVLIEWAQTKLSCALETTCLSSVNYAASESPAARNY
jgi:hypothetical protein